MGRLGEWLKGGPVVTDGAWGTEFQRHGLPAGEAPDLWNLDRPSVVEAVARDYALAGSSVVLTNTFQANPISLEGRGAAGRAAQINRRGVALSRAGAPGCAVFGSVGPTGSLGTVGAGAVAGAFRVQVEALAGAGVDAIVLETFFDLEEALLALVGATATGKPVVVSFHFGPGETLRGVSVEEAARRVARAGADAVGANCGDGPAGLAALCRRLASASGLPVWVKPNAGLPDTLEGRPSYGIGPEAFAAYWPELVAAGASFLGGCCGTGPEHVRAMAERARGSTG